ncbi:molybdopterin molybdenumtransferase MoeA [Labrys okinawensis]|uniref:Molybdopterin molybdenumtransferase n=1 Tax=Labrys okinawensis TaxID=346911 RepID=A0A2S9Q6W1_9HYPH|nr:gephyrin-like molybdotransferase Glp [Labrys okinawensis]PRH85077.1 molybdopterin molybdenumtransferase MoeA [Labrys okinawensis]
MSLLPVADALAKVVAGVTPLSVETVALHATRGRVLAAAITALRTQPGFNASAMDGYAVRADDARQGASLELIGESAAGHGYAGRVGENQAVRIFTGAPVPDGADTVVIQEQTRRDGNRVILEATAKPGQHIRARGLDFAEGREALSPGTVIGPRDIALAAAMNHPGLPVHRRPKVAILATGDELVLPGQAIGENQIVASNNFAIRALVEAEGGEVLDLGIASDDFPALEAAIKRARSEKADVLVTIGGASVGDHDLIQTALTREGMQLGFWKIAMRPGKPLLHGRLGPMHILGLPGNPVSSVVCGVLFLVPLLRTLLGRSDAGPPRRRAVFASSWPANDVREDYIRARFMLDDTSDILKVEPLALQDSSLVSVMQHADCLVIRPPFAPEAKAGESCEIIDLRAAGY